MRSCAALLLAGFYVLSTVQAWSHSMINVSRRTAVGSLVATTVAPFLVSPEAVSAKCTDIESCREIGEKKVDKDLKDNPRFRLDGGVTYKVLKPGIGSEVVKETSTVDLIFSVNGNGGYMYSRGFGFEKIDLGNGKVTDLGIDSYLAPLGKGLLPVGIESALVGMKRGERRRVALPPAVGLETSNWQPEPRSYGGKQAIEGYKRRLAGNGSNQPPYMAPTIWDIEIVSMRNKNLTN